jgi:TetR/AcrR family transcriptional regulator, cholesterol catabolism regulator
MATAGRKGRRPAGELTDSPASVKRRHEIVQKAAELFDDVGYHVTSMDDIARAVGLAKPTLYHYFPSKESILLAVHEEFISLLLTRQRSRESDMDRPVVELLYEVMFDIIDLMRTHHGHVRVFFEHHRELTGDALQRTLAARDTYFASVQSLLERGQETGLVVGDAHLSTLALFGMCNWAYQWYHANGVWTTQDVARYFHRVLLTGIGVGVDPDAALALVASAGSPFATAASKG